MPSASMVAEHTEESFESFSACTRGGMKTAACSRGSLAASIPWMTDVAVAFTHLLGSRTHAAMAALCCKKAPISTRESVRSADRRMVLLGSFRSAARAGVCSASRCAVDGADECSTKTLPWRGQQGQHLHSEGLRRIAGSSLLQTHTEQSEPCDRSSHSQPQFHPRGPSVWPLHSRSCRG